jgi:hypothetical protein
MAGFSRSAPHGLVNDVMYATTDCHIQKKISNVTICNLILILILGMP